MSSNPLTVRPRGDCELVMTRRFDAPRALVFRALSEPRLVRKWLLGPSGWPLVTCEIDFRVDGAFRYVWRDPGGDGEVGMGGRFVGIDPPGRTVHTERFDQAWYPGSATVTTRLTEAGGITTFERTVRYDSREARDIVAASAMRAGAGAGYDRLDQLLSDLAAGPRM